MKKIFKLTEQDLKEIIVSSVRKVLKESDINKLSSENYNFELKEFYPGTSDWDYIKNNKQSIWDFLNDGYRYVGYERFCGCDNSRSLLKNANLIKIVFYNNEWIAISVYTGYRGGFKNVGITATIDEKLRSIGVSAVHNIIKNDIGKFNEYFWSECSGSIEKLYEKYNGIKMPNEYVFAILNTPISLDEDGFHYTRQIKGDIQRKIIYGFNNKETFDIVLKEHEEYINKHLSLILSNKINEDVEKVPFGKMTRLDCAIAIVNFFVDERWEGECYDFPVTCLGKLRREVEIIRTALENKTVPENKQKLAEMALENGIDILETSSPLQMFKL